MSLKDFREQQDAASPLSFLRFWRQDSAEVRREVATYHSDSVLQSSRGRSGLLVVLLATLALASGMLTKDLSAGIIGAVVYALIAIGCFRGSRAALIVAMTVFSLDRILGLLAGAVLLSIIWWGVGMGLLFRAYTVERARRAAVASAPGAV